MTDYPHDQELHERFERLEAGLLRVEEAIARVGAEGEPMPIAFKPTQTVVTDDQGHPALSYAVYNPTNVKVFVALAGTSATKDGLIVPKQKLVVAPLQVNGNIQLGVDPTELGEETIRVIRWRFVLPQPFFVGALN